MTSARHRSRAARERFGRRAEWAAAWWLRLQGWRILDQRIRTPRGEVDIIARRGRILAFVEVKARAGADELAQAIDAHRLRRVAAAAEALAPRYAKSGDSTRIDVLLLAPWRWPHHLANAWQPHL